MSKEMRQYHTFKDELAIMDGITMIGEGVIIPDILQQQAIKQLHVKHISNEDEASNKRISVPS